jgi:hypothetical protein
MRSGFKYFSGAMPSSVALQGPCKTDSPLGSKQLVVALHRFACPNRSGRQCRPDQRVARLQRNNIDPITRIDPDVREPAIRETQLEMRVLQQASAILAGDLTVCSPPDCQRCRQSGLYLGRRLLICLISSHCSPSFGGQSYRAELVRLRYTIPSRGAQAAAR